MKCRHENVAYTITTKSFSSQRGDFKVLLLSNDKQNSVSHSLKKWQGAGQKRALLMCEIHPKGHFC